MPTDDLALVADLLDARLNLHDDSFVKYSGVVGSAGLLVAVNDPATREVIGRKLHDYAVVRKDSDVVHPHLAADMCEHLVPVIKFNPEHRIGQ